MRVMLILAAAVALSACATTSGGDDSYQVQMAELRQSCDDRGGILVSIGIGGARPQENYACRISGGPSERLQRAGG